ncbi:MAG: error-prone DNA polymerase [Rhodospirillaceae bacterium]|nr:MAG: error-prone DNA polymerase [Rhodospirillaceae bacterium]
MTSYIDLQVTTNFSFLHGASHASELVDMVQRLGRTVMAVTDRNTLAGIVRAHAACKETGLRLIVGARIDLTDAPSVLVYPTDRAAYGRLARLLTMGKRRAEKGQCLLARDDLLAHADGQMAIALPTDQDDGANLQSHLGLLKDAFGARLSLAVHYSYDGADEGRLERLASIGASTGVPLVAVNDVLYHHPDRRALQDVLTCIREKCTIATAGYRLAANAERYLKPSAEMARLFRRYPAALDRTAEIAACCTFSLDELRYEYPAAAVVNGRTPQAELGRLTWEGAAARYPAGIPDKVRDLLTRELALIAELNYAPYFLTVWDLVRFAESREILCQGRGSAANSAVCYALRITSVDPTKVDLLFERFISAERNEPPDIDVDFEHERREEVIQYIYATYGRDKAGLAATVISYRPRSALRDVGKAMGLPLDAVDVLACTVWGWGAEGINEDDIREAGLDPADPHLRCTLELARMVIGFPRHLSQHVGGFVITRGPLDELVPIENAAMEERTVIEWDKDDLDTLGILKIDVLALGMLTCIRKAFELLTYHYDKPLILATVPQDDPHTYAMLSRADSLGVFQVESRAQMTMLPRLKPQNFYDLVIEVAIVRPGPIQGDMVHPYLRRRSGAEKVTYPSKELEEVLNKTCGVPLFQEQAMKIAIVAAGFTPSESDQLRRAMATFRRMGTIGNFERKFIDGMVANGYDADFAARCFAQIKGFGEYGFPESHAASFALLVYVSAWIKCHYPAVFACALLNAQPMGFYNAAQIVRDAREHGVDVRPVDVNASDWDNTLEPMGIEGFALRLGIRQVKGAREIDAVRLMQVRGTGYRDLHDLWRRSGLSVRALTALAQADAFVAFGLDRRTALWRIGALNDQPLPLFVHGENQSGHNGSPNLFAEPAVVLPSMTLGEHVIADYTAMSLSLKKHPLALLRSRLKAEGRVIHGALSDLPTNTRVAIAGLVLVRQCPGTAKGVLFATLEDETGVANVIVWPHVLERYRRIVLGSALLGVVGKVQSEENVTHVIADRLTDLTDLLRTLPSLDGECENASNGLHRSTQNMGAIDDRNEMRKIVGGGRNFR